MTDPSPKPPTLAQLEADFATWADVEAAHNTWGDVEAGCPTTDPDDRQEATRA